MCACVCACRSDFTCIAFQSRRAIVYFLDSTLVSSIMASFVIGVVYRYLFFKVALRCVCKHLSSVYISKATSCCTVTHPFVVGEVYYSKYRYFKGDTVILLLGV